jgi:CBS domain containing-hemolysin-like protein
MKDLWIIFGCWVISFLFNGIEAGLMAVDPVRLRHHLKLNLPAAVRLDRFLKSPERPLVTVLLITNFVDIVALILLARQFVSRFGGIGFVLTVLVATPIYLFVLGVLPKSLFRRFPFRALAALSRPLEFSVTLLWPILTVGEQIGRFLLPSPAKKRARLFAARDELKQITAQSEREGSITATERAMIHNVVDFQNVTAGDVMKPLSKIESLTADSTIQDAVELSRWSGFDRLPVIDSNGDAIGLIDAFDILLDKERQPSLARYLRRMVTVQDNEPAGRAVQRLRAARLGLAAVVDQKRNLSGFVASEDLIARLVRA